MGRVVAILFFVMISFAAITSAVSVLEAVASTVMDSHKISRNRAVTIVMIPTFAAGVLIALGYGPLDFIQIAGKNLLDIFDYVSNTILMPVVAFLMCIFVGHVIGTKVVTDEIEKNGWTLVPSKYIEFIDHDLEIDFSSEMKRIQQEVRDVLAQEKQSQEMLVKAFKGIGYAIG